MGRQHAAAAVATAVLAAVVLDLRLQPGGAFATRAVDDLAQAGAAAAAAAVSALRARSAHGRRRASWALIGAGTGSWGAGELIWSYYELLAHRATPFPSLADVGYLMFPLLAGAGIAVRPSRAFAGRARLRVLLDVLLVLISLVTISWATALRLVYEGGRDGALGTMAGLAYPLLDIALLTVVVVVLGYSRSGSRAALVFLGSGLMSLAVADSGFAYLTALGTYRTGDLVDIGWIGGFLLVALGALWDGADNSRRGHGGHRIPKAVLLLPYLPAGVGVSVALGRVVLDGPDAVMICAAVGTVWLLVLRQVIVLLDNQALMGRISHQALHDELTGLANRTLFADRLEHALELHRRDLNPVAVLLVDLDDFKGVNDALGHHVGDELLLAVSARLSAATRASDTVARLGGDEFAVVLEDVDDPLTAASRILDELSDPARIAGHVIPLGASIGVAVLTADEAPVSGNELLRRADLALYQAKRAGKGCVCLFEPQLNDARDATFGMRSALAADIQAGAIDFALQPIFGVDGSAFGGEALARWRYNGEPVPPGVFLPLARRLGLAARLDELVLEAAVMHAVTWSQPGLLSVNLTETTLADARLADRLRDLLRRSGLPAERLMVEVLEHSLLEQRPAAVKTLSRLRALGVKIAVDDFGAGYTGLFRLHALRPDVVKLDRTLIRNTAQDDQLLDGITELAHRVDALVVAEGVEDGDQLATVRRAGCDAVQGYLLGGPQTPADFDAATAAVEPAAMSVPAF